MRRTTETRLRSAFADVLTAVLATAAVGCGGSTNNAPSEFQSNTGAYPASPLTPGFTSLCAVSQKSFLQGLKAVPALDGIEMRSETAFPLAYGTGTTPAEQGDAWKASNGEIAGTMCTTATNMDGCLAVVNGFRFLPPTRAECTAKYPQPSYTNPPITCGATYYLYTRGDEIGVAQTDAEIKALMGTIDTLEEAMYLATKAGYSQSCGASPTYPDSEFRQNADGSFDLHLVQNQDCTKRPYSLEAHVDFVGNVTETSRTEVGSIPGCAVAGRRPAGLRLAEDGSSVGAHFATMAQLEAASVVAFRRLHRQLAAFGAPADLLARIRKAARDEIRHARATGALARKYGVAPCAPDIAPEGETSLFEIAIENAREGCVRETFGALVAHLQAERAGDADVRRVMAEIADEETAHAALSWDIAAWLESQLGSEQRQALAGERQKAFDALARALAAPVDSCILHASGIPAPAVATRMLEGLAPLMLAA